jgi:hypothetical protein
VESNRHYHQITIGVVLVGTAGENCWEKLNRYATNVQSSLTRKNALHFEIVGIDNELSACSVRFTLECSASPRAAQHWILETFGSQLRGAERVIYLYDTHCAKLAFSPL